MERLPVPKQSCMEFWKLTTSVFWYMGVFLFPHPSLPLSGSLYCSSTLPSLHPISLFVFFIYLCHPLMPSFYIISIELGSPDNSWHSSICYHAAAAAVVTHSELLWWQSWCLFRGGICCLEYPAHSTVAEYYTSIPRRRRQRKFRLKPNKNAYTRVSSMNAAFTQCRHNGKNRSMSCCSNLVTPIARLLVTHHFFWEVSSQSEIPDIINLELQGEGWCKCFSHSVACEYCLNNMTWSGHRMATANT